MNLQFNIDYQTSYGDDLILNIIDNESRDVVAKYRMNTADGIRWTCDLRREAKPEAAICYYYSVERNGSETQHEWLVEPHMLDISAAKGVRYVVYDHWIAMPEDSYLYSSAFTECISRRRHRDLPPTDNSVTVTLKVRAPQLRSNHRLAVVGAQHVLGTWQLDKAKPMVEHQPNEWTIDINAAGMAGDTLEFKFVATDENQDLMPLWETQDNREITLPPMKTGDVVVYELNQAFFPIYNMKSAGTLVPVFSLRTDGSFGVGDFGDLCRMIDWVNVTGQRVLQILPINDTTTTKTWTDSYPYSCISIFALHPQYADLRQLPPLDNESDSKRFETLRRELNALTQIDYERVNRAKEEYLHLLYEQEGKAVLASQEFKDFFDDSEHWLVPYAQYCMLRDKNGTADFTLWENNTTWNEADRKNLTNQRSKAYREVAYFYYVQFVLDRQMRRAHDYAREKGVVLKGDIPIGVNRHGCDVWQEPRYFNLNGQAGAPPDDFSVNGQNWGFPTYNWDEMLTDGCRWWVCRFRNMAKYFDAYRIDHVLGFFRIWEIPADAVHGLLGHFAPSLGMTREEIEAYGLAWQEQLFTEPFITDWVLDRVFHEDAEAVRREFVEQAGYERYRMKEQYATQRKVEQWYLAEKAKGEPGRFSMPIESVRDGLYAIISNVLFVRDHKDHGRFHPRISVQFDFIYESLYDSDKYFFNRLYNDYYYRRNNQFWYQEAMKKLPLLVQATRMLVCAEDLGMVPDCVPWVMNELRILSLELQSMPKDTHVRFGRLDDNPYRSVCTISSHDMPTLRQWWDDDESRAQDYFNSVLRRDGAAPHPMPGWLAYDIIARHLASPSMLCILSIQDWLAIYENLRLADRNAERINIPANPKHYWRYRMHLNIEDMLGNGDLTASMTEMIRNGGRK
ncbi:MAG: 4-alpha-glucanotransferase [Prevotella sp.]|uniref:4-alpha-glucanotransferase n=1 Tax=Prevotella sp. TaxID=59823 RepID=UPI002A2B73E6|nr:4-alpha-glucanotransferase [Prevotella sp.]MDD7319305.1 4-alpha-glucanotransferase [Prevotellaceae bacterium]MDY4020865.1 4-alpha-glucanotransferase [Prevotella sp.]